MIQNPVLRGFCPDPSIIRMGQEYYIAVSTFEWWPGVGLYHSTDLAHWEQLKSPLRRESQLNMLGNPVNGGIWAPCLSYDGERFYLLFTDVKTQKRPWYNTHNYMVWTDEIEGEWSDPVYLNSIGFDPSLFHDDDGKKYLINMIDGFEGIVVQELDFASKKLVGPSKKVFSGTALGCTEGPHIYKKDGWYYLLLAEGGTGYNHAATLARARSIWGPYEENPANPLLTSVGAQEDALQKAGHASLVQTPEGDWYLAHLCARPVPGSKDCILGRETAIQKLVWEVGEWPRLALGGRFPAWQVPQPTSATETHYTQAPQRDDFTGPVLHNAYTFHRVSPGEAVSLQARPGWLRLYGREALSSNHHVTLAARRQTEHHMDAETLLDFAPQYKTQAAGMAYMYNNENFFLLVKTKNTQGATVLRFYSAERAKPTEPVNLVEIADGPLGLRLEMRGAEARFYYKEQGSEWKQAGGAMNAARLSDDRAPGFTGAHIALYCHDMAGGRLYADFDYLNILPVEANHEAVGDL